MIILQQRLIYSDINPDLDIDLKYYTEVEDSLHILPYYEMKRSFRKRLLEYSNQEVIDLTNTISIGRLFKKLYSKVGSYKMISDEQLRYLLLNLLKETDYYYLNQKSIDYVVEFINQVDARLVDLDEQALNHTLLEELKSIYQKLNSLLSEKGFTTKWKAYQELLAELKAEDFTFFYPEVKELFFSRLQIIKPVELELILKLTDFVTKTVIYLDYNPDKPKLFLNLDYVVERLKKEGFSVEDKRANAKGLITELFSDKFKQEKYSWQEEMGTNLQVGSYQDQIVELKAVARKIVELAQMGQPLAEIGIAFAKPDRYLPHLERIFNEYNIPYQQSLEIPLANSQLIGDLQAVSALLTGQFSADELLTVVSSEFFSFDYDGSLIDRLLKLLNQLRFEAEGWQLVDLLLRIAEEEVVVEFLKKLKEDCSWDLTTKVEFEEFQARLASLLTGFSLADNLEKANQTTLAAWEEFKQQFNSLAEIITEPESLKHCLEVLNLVIKEGSYTPSSKQGVEVTGKIELRSGSYDYIFLVGLSHDLYPTIRKNPLDKYLASLGIKADNRMVRDRYLLYNHLIAARQGVFITYSKAASEDEAISSSCIEELARVVELDELSSTDKIYSELELQEELGYDLKAGKLNGLALEYDWGSQLKKKFKLVEDKTRAEIAGYNANLTDKDNLAWLKQRFNADYNYSASLLENYLACPFQFLLAELFNLEQLEFGEEMNPLERGGILHSILEHFHAEFGEQRITEATYQQAEQALLKAAQEVIAENKLFNSSFYWQTEKERYLKDGELGVVLREFLDNEAKGDFFSHYSTNIKANEFITKASEWSFRDFEVLDGYLLQGKVDRIAYHPKRDCYAVIDYKTGKLKYTKLANSPLQLPIYMLAVEQEYPTEVSFAGYCSLHPNQEGQRYKVPLADVDYKKKQKKLEQYLDEAPQLVKAIAERIKSGQFMASEDSNCDWCQYKYSCRKEGL